MEKNEEEMESASDSSIPCNQQAYANVTKQRKEKERLSKMKEEDRKKLAEIIRKAQ